MNPATPVIALIHGYGFDVRIWNPVELAFEGFTVVRLHLPGFGSDTITGPYTMEDLALHFWAELDSMGFNRVHLIGHSMGGYACMEMISLQPDRVSSLSLIHSHVFADSEEKKKARTTTLEEINSSGRSAFVHRMIGGMIADKTRLQPILDHLITRGMKYGDEAWYNGTRAIRDRKDHSHTLRSLHVPVLVVMGEADIAVPVAMAHQQAAMAEWCTLVIYSGVGHLSMYENTSGLLCDLSLFLKQQI